MSRWRVAALLVTSAGSILLASAEPPTPAAPGARYTLRATLDPDALRLDGRGRVRWRNPSTAPIAELRFSLYYKARPGARADAALEVTSLRVTSADRDVLPTSTLTGADDQTHRGAVLHVALDPPLAPGGELSLDIAWVTTIPAAAATGGVVMLTDWFPQLQTAGDDGSYDVTLDVPRGWSVAATGRQQAVAAGAARETRRFWQEHARDFAWAASRDWIEQRARVEREGLPPVEIRVLGPPDRAGQLSRLTAAAALALQRGPELLATYPYADLTILDLPWRSPYADAAHAGLVTVATRWLQPRNLTELESALAGVLAKHYWQQTVGIDGLEQPAMAEGFAVYTAERLGWTLIERQLDSPSGDGFLVQRYFGGFIPYVNRSVRFNHAAERASAAGVRTARMLSTLEHYLGWPTLEVVLNEFAARCRFRRPDQGAFADVTASVSNRDLRWFFDGALRERLRFDYAVEQVTAETPPSGVAHRTAIVVMRLGDGIFSGATAGRTSGYESGRAIEIEVAFGDGTVRREHWDGRDRRAVFVYESAAPVERIEIDPAAILRLDTARTNNSWTRVSRAAAASSRWSAIWWLWLEDLLLNAAALA